MAEIDFDDIRAVDLNLLVVLDVLLDRNGSG